MKIGAIVSFIIEGDVWLYNARSKYRQKQLLNESLLVGSDPMCVVKDEEKRPFNFLPKFGKVLSFSKKKTVRRGKKRRRKETRRDGNYEN